MSINRKTYKFDITPEGNLARTKFIVELFSLTNDIELRPQLKETLALFLQHGCEAEGRQLVVDYYMTKTSYLKQLMNSLRAQKLLINTPVGPTRTKRMRVTPKLIDFYNFCNSNDDNEFSLIMLCLKNKK